MHTQRTILLIVASIALAAVVASTSAVVWLGWSGLLVVLGAALVILVAYRLFVEPWHVRWGASDAEVAASLPGDDLLAGARGSTRAVSVAAPPADVWPWLVQLGFGRAGWYSYDWIDNDGHPSADRIVPELQSLAVGDRILMTPDMGFEVRAIDPGHSLLSQAPDGTTWCLALLPDGASGSRLVSRFRVVPGSGLGAALWNALAGPGSFIMERRMLVNLRRLAGAVPHGS